MSSKAIRSSVVLILALLLLSSCAGGPSVRSGQKDSAPKGGGAFRIAFGSCNKQHEPNPMWKAIMNCKPDLWIWLGDSIYAATEDMTYLRQQYDLQKGKPEYQEFLKRVPVIGTWDDNDYGKKNGDQKYSKKAESQQLYLDFLDEPKDSPRRRQQGIYYSYSYGQVERQIKVILLDVHYHRTDPGPEGDLLGEAQWAWLEQELRNSPAGINLVCSSSQVVSSEHPYDKWADFPKSQQRLLNLFRDTKARGIVVLSGDRHLAEISRMNDSTVGYPIYDVTASGLTHHVDEIWHVRNLFSPEKNRYRIAHLFTEQNFGVIDIDWNHNPVSLTFQIRDQENAIRLKHQAGLSEIHPK